MATKPVTDMIAYMTENPVLQGAPTIHNLSFLDGLSFTKSEISQQKELFIVVGELEFHPGKRDETLVHWKGNVDSGKDETGLFEYGMYVEEGKPDTLFTLEAYKSEKYLMDVHVKTKAVQSTIEKTKDLRKQLTLNKLKFHAGFANENA
jgi:quinol monooxygenase YgiN